MLEPYPFTVLISNPDSEEDRYHDHPDDWTAPDVFARCADIQQRTATEILDGRTATVDEWVGFFEPCAEVTARSRVLWVERETTFEVVGVPNQMRYGDRLDHIEARLKAVAG